MKNQYRYIEHLPSLSEEDIAKHKNFKNILDKRTGELQKRIDTRKKILKGGLSIAFIGAIALALIIWENYTSQKEGIIAVDIENLDNVISENEAQKLELPTAKREQQDKPKAITNRMKTKEKPINKQTESSEKPSFQIGYQRALPIVGMDSLSHYLNQNLNYPEEVDKSQVIEGTVNVIFTITTEGKASKIQIENSLGEAFDEECKRLISNMPRWEPALRNGKAVDSKVSLQLSFKMDQYKD
ncbi:energy transducer TonB [Marivirga tractuosa]|uniref:energy transducer TonB n=1 Tax=Marivirga tractuosa TaxID=1006 RepID=UPI0035D04118